MITIIDGPKKSSYLLFFVMLFSVAAGYFGASYGMEEVLVVDDQRDAQYDVQKQIEADKALALQTAVRAMHESDKDRDTDSSASLSSSPASSSNGSAPASPTTQASLKPSLSPEEAARKREEENALMDGECCICFDDYGQKKDLAGVSPDRYKFDKTAVPCVEKVKLTCGHVFCDSCIGGWLHEADVKKEKDVFFPRWLVASESFRPESISCPVCRGDQPVAQNGVMVLARCAYCLDPLSTAYENATFFDCLVVDHVFADSPFEKICRGPKARRAVTHRFHENCLHEWFGHKDFKSSMRQEGLVMLCPCHRYDEAKDLSTDRYGGYIIIARDSELFKLAQFMVDNPNEIKKSPREEEEEIAEIVRKQDEELAAQEREKRFGKPPWWFTYLFGK
jgi:hypothetical protein